MPLKEQALFAEVKPEVVKLQRHMVTSPKVMVFTKVRAYILCLKTFEFVSIHTQK